MNGEKEYRIIVAHPNRQHSFRLASALKRNGWLCKYITTVYDKNNSLTALMKKCVGHKYSHKISGKKCDYLEDDEVLQFYETQGLLFLIMIRIPFLKKYYRKFGAYINNRFGIKVAKTAIKLNADIVIMFDTTADACFEYLKRNAPNIIRVLDMSSNVSIERVKIYEKYMEIAKSDALKKENIHLWDSKFTSRNRRELKNSNYFLTPSVFSKNSILNQGIEPKSIFLNPYGVDTIKFSTVNKEHSTDNILRLVYSGGVTYGKGIDYLLESIVELSDCELDINLLGQYNAEDDIYKKYCTMPNIHFNGFVPQNDLIRAYAQADAFVFPSLGEGLSLAALEAMSCGLPLICSTNSGVNDLIDNYRNGIIFGAGDKEQLKEAIRWAYRNKSKLIEMSCEAKDTALKYTWDAYDKRVEDIVERIMEGR